MSDYHSHNLNVLKRSVGASYMAYERIKDTYHLKVIKDAKPRYFILEGSPDDVTPEKYEKLLNLLQQTYGSL